LYAVTVPEKPGSFRDFCRVLSNRAVTEFNYRYADQEDAKIFLGTKIADESDKNNFIEKL